MSKRVLVLRFSALGDVAMTVPVIYSFKEKYPDFEIVFVSRPFAQKIYSPIDGVKFVAVDFNNKHKGIVGLFRLYKKLRSCGSYTFVADLHGVLRSFVLGGLFRFSGVKVFSIDKGRNEKKALCKHVNKVFKPLKPTIDRYSDVFAKAGYPFQYVDFPGNNIYNSNSQKLVHDLLITNNKKIGIAPYAKHNWKMYPAKKMFQLVQKLNETNSFQIYLFGGRGDEEKQLDEWANEFDNVHNFAGQLTMDDELKAMATLDVMVTMDSANMHLASLVNTPVISIWGATHPFAGFFGWKQDMRNAVQVDLDCRPCSVFGNKQCHRGDFACMEQILVDDVFTKILKTI